MLQRNSDFLHFWVPFPDFTKLLKIIKIKKVGCDGRSGNRTKLIWTRKPDFTKEERSPNQRVLNKKITLSLFANQNRRSKQSSRVLLRENNLRDTNSIHVKIVCRKLFLRRRSARKMFWIVDEMLILSMTVQGSASCFHQHHLARNPCEHAISNSILLITQRNQLWERSHTVVFWEI